MMAVLPISRYSNQVLRGVSVIVSETKGQVLLAISAGWFLSLGVRMIYPVLLPYFREAYSLDLRLAGLLLTVLWGGYAIGQLPGGVLTDWLGERIVLSLSTLVSAVMLVFVVTAGFPIVLFVTTGLFGLATALYGVARFTAVSEVFPNRDGIAIGITLAAGNLGNVVLPATGGTIAAVFAWYYGLGFTIPLFALVAVGLWSVVPTTSVKETNSGQRNVRKIVLAVLHELRRPPIIIVTVILILSFSIWQSFTGFYPTYLIEIKGFSPAVATGIFSLYFALGIVIQPLAGAAYDRFGIRRTLPVFLGGAAMALIALPLTTGLIPVLGLTVFLAGMMSNIAVTMPFLTDELPSEIQGTGLGVLRTGYMLIGAISPTLFGSLADVGLFDEAFWFLAGLVGLIFVCLWFLDEN